MTPQPAQARYHPTWILIHWLTLLVLVGVYISIKGYTYFPRGSAVRAGLRTWHFMLGLTVFGLVWLRLGLRLFCAIPPIVPALPRWQHRLSRAMPGALYLVMFGMPVGGCLILSVAGKPIPFFGLELPAVMAPDKVFMHSVEKIHETVGNIALYLIGLHALAGLFHHYDMRDNTLRRISLWRSHGD